MRSLSPARVHDNVCAVRIVRALVLGGMLSSLASVAAAQVMDPPVVVESFERARDRGNLDAAVSYFTDDATIVVLGSETQVVGKNGVRGFLQLMRQPPLIISSRHVVGNTVTWTERHQGQRPVDLAVQAVIQDGKIKSLTYGLALPPVQPVARDATSATLSAAAAMAGIGLLASLALVLAMRATPRPPSTSALSGKLLGSLAEWRRATRAS
jgi:hypothetical protein